MKPKYIGWISVLATLVLPISTFIVSYYFYGRTFQNIEPYLLAVVALVLGIGVYSFNIFKIGDDKITIIYLFNPLKKTVRLSADEIDKIVIKQKQQHIMLTMVFCLKDGREISVFTRFLWRERNEMITALINSDVNFETVII